MIKFEIRIKAFKAQAVRLLLFSRSYMSSVSLLFKSMHKIIFANSNNAGFLPIAKMENPHGAKSSPCTSTQV